jgi:hypothetical protein
VTSVTRLAPRKAFRRAAALYLQGIDPGLDGDPRADDYLKDDDPLYLEILGVLFAALALRSLAWRHRSVALRSVA